MKKRLHHQKRTLDDPQSNPDFNPDWMPGIHPNRGIFSDFPSTIQNYLNLFRNIYYYINRYQASLASTDRGDLQEHRILQQELEHWLIQRDALEDECHCLGLVVEPVVEDRFIVQLRFNAASKRKPSPVARRYSKLIKIDIPQEWMNDDFKECMLTNNRKM